jgi:hypothetical protein
MPSCYNCGEPIEFSDFMVSETTGKKIPLEHGSEIPHDCSEDDKSYSILRCNLCAEEITFSDDYVSSKSGKKISLDPMTEEPHHCEVWEEQHRKYYLCRNNCGNEIYFDKNHKSKYGKSIPMDKQTSQAHQCPNDPFTRT